MTLLLRNKLNVVKRRTDAKSSSGLDVGCTEWHSALARNFQRRFAIEATNFFDVRLMGSLASSSPTDGGNPISSSSGVRMSILNQTVIVCSVLVLCANIGWMENLFTICTSHHWQGSFDFWFYLPDFWAVEISWNENPYFTKLDPFPVDSLNRLQN